MTRTPDILVVMADQLNPAVLECYGTPLAVTPHLDALASRGTTFLSAYTSAPLCSPGRAGFMTGRLPSSFGVFDNAAEFPSSIPTFAHLLRSAGYRTVLSGKMHFCGPDQLHGFEDRLTTDIYPADFGWTPTWDNPDERPTWYHDMSSVVTSGVCLRSNQLDFDDEVGWAAEREIYDHVRRRGDQPLCLVASFTHPHDPYACRQEDWDLYQDREIPPPSVRLTEAEMSPHERRIWKMCQMDQVTPTESQIASARRAYLGSVSYWDHQLGRLIGALDAVDRLSRCVVVVTSDHGDALGERGLWYKMTVHDTAARVPLVLAGPGIAEGATVARPVSTLDLLPTLADVGGAPLPARLATELDGHSLSEDLVSGARDGTGDPAIGTSAAAGDNAAAGDKAAAGDPPVFCEYLAEGAVAPVIAVVDNGWKLIVTPDDPDQLYHLSDDPLEITNLAEAADRSGAAAEVLSRLRSLIDQRYDLAELDTLVRSSQQRRRSVDLALNAGRYVSWDFEPQYRADHRYIRRHDLGDSEALARWPRSSGHGRVLESVAGRAHNQSGSERGDTER